MANETMKQTAEQVAAQRPEFRADEVGAVLSADPTLTATEVIAALDEAKAEHVANVAAEQ